MGEFHKTLSWKQVKTLDKLHLLAQFRFELLYEIFLNTLFSSFWGDLKLMVTSMAFAVCLEQWITPSLTWESTHHLFSERIGQLPHADTAQLLDIPN